MYSMPRSTTSTSIALMHLLMSLLKALLCILCTLLRGISISLRMLLRLLPNMVSLALKLISLPIKLSLLLLPNLQSTVNLLLGVLDVRPAVLLPILLHVVALLLSFLAAGVGICLHLLKLIPGLLALGLDVVGAGPHDFSDDAEDGGEGSPEGGEDVLAAVVLAGSLAVLVEVDVGDVVAGGEVEVDGEGEELEEEVFDVVHVGLLDGWDVGVDVVEGAVA